MNKTWAVDNIKCGGCAQRISQQLAKIASVSNVLVNVEEGTVSAEFLAEQEAVILERLNRLGYPLTGTISGLTAVEADVRSVFSCALGKLNANH